GIDSRRRRLVGMADTADIGDTILFSPNAMCGSCGVQRACCSMECAVDRPKRYCRIVAHAIRNREKRDVPRGLSAAGIAMPAWACSKARGNARARRSERRPLLFSLSLKMPRRPQGHGSLVRK